MSHSSSFIHKLFAPVRYAWRLVTNPYLWVSLAGMGAVLYGTCEMIDNVLMPWYTRQDTVVYVPDLVGLPLEEANAALTELGLRAGTPTERFDSEEELEHVLEQRPKGGSNVKPSRTVYLIINRGTERMVTVPDVIGYSMRGAANRIEAAGLRIGSMQPDSLPSPYRDTITRQDPPPGSLLSASDSLRLWYGTGPGTRPVLVPDVTGLTPGEAEAILARVGLRAVVLDLEAGATGVQITRQNRSPGSSVREGSEVRLSVAADSVLFHDED